MNILNRTILMTVLAGLSVSIALGQEPVASKQEVPCVRDRESNCEKPKADGKEETKDNSKESTTPSTVAAARIDEAKAPPDEPAAPGPAAESLHTPQQTDEQKAQELAKKLSNPVASLISFPFQANLDSGLGPNSNGFRFTLNIQPVIPIALNEDWNLISRTILPVMYQSDVVPETTQFGLSDTVQSFFFSPNKTEPFIWGVGPQFLIPTATDKFLGTEKFGIGPTFVILKQKGRTTIGGLVNHMWSVAGDDDRADVNSTFMQPFVSYTTKEAWTFTGNTESTYDWTAGEWNVPVHFQVSKLTKVGKQPVSVGVGLRCWVTSAPGGPEGCGFRIIFTPLFPKK